MDRIGFKINEVPYTVGSEVSSDVKLVDYLRNELNLSGTKFMCRAGGCGACIVGAIKSPGGKIESVNSCLVGITSCQGWEITTVEHVGNESEGYHPIQTALAKNHGSQCGYCTPGWVMAMYNLLKSKGDITMLEIEKSLGSNICRCTGYRPILQAFKTFGADAPKPDELIDIEELKICDESKCVESKCCGDCYENDWCFVADSDTVDGPYEVQIQLKDKITWYSVRTVRDVLNLFRREGTDSYILVNGNTSQGLFPREYPRNLIDISQINELKGYKLDQNLIIGAGCSLTETMEIFKTVSEREEFSYLKKFNEHLEKVANLAVRNLGSIGGNLMIKHEQNNISDVFLLLETVGADITVASRWPFTRRENVTLDKFLQTDMKGKLILNIIFPPLSKEHHVETFKVMSRASNAPAIVIAGFLYKLSSDNKVLEARMVYEGLSSRFRRATKCEKHLINKNLFFNTTLQSAIQTLTDELVVTEMGDFSVEYRKHLALALFYKSLLILCPDHLIDDKYRSGAINLIDTRPVSESTQNFTADESIWPLNQPIEKIEAKIQCSGEAKYTDDIPIYPGEVFATFVRTKVATGNLESIDASEALKQPGVIAFYSAEDIPGVNSFTPAGNIFYAASEEVFCSGAIKHHGQAVGVIVAETRHLAETAADLVKLTYSGVTKPVTDVKEAKNDSSRLTPYVQHEPTDKGTTVDKTLTGSNSAAWQYHLPIETLTTVTRPVDDCLEVYNPSQGMDAGHVAIASALNINKNRVEMICRRLGGSYGLKISRNTQLAVASGLVSLKLRKPCRMIQSLSTNLKAVGKRFPYTADYEVSIDNSGVIQEMNCQLYMDNGYVYNEVISLFAIDIFYNAYDPARWNFKGYDLITDTPKNTFCRSPGTLESIANAEWVMEHIAYTKGLDPFDVRLVNLDQEKYGELTKMVADIKTSADYTNRRALVDKYNAEHRWKKRGLRTSFVRWTPFGGLNLNVTISIYHGDGSISITHGGVEMGQGMNTKAVQTCAYMLNVPVEKINVKKNESMIAPNSGITGASVSTQNVMMGVRRGCEMILERLKPFKDDLGDVSWEELIKAAHTANTNLQANAYVSFTDSINSFNVLAVALCETEVDILTGQREILRVDILEDAGRSVNQGIDVGQIEGAFMMGVGYWTSENISINRDTGEVLTDSILKYTVPLCRDIPQNFVVSLKENSNSAEEIMGAKAIGEPATCLAVVVPISLREAVMSARRDAGKSDTEWISPDGPSSVENICMMAATSTDEFKFN